MTYVEIGRTSGVELQTISLHAVSMNSRFSSYVAPWAGPRSWSTLSLQTAGRLTLRGPASKEVDREETFPSPESPMADDGWSTNAPLTGCVPPPVSSRGGELVALIRVRDRVSIVPSRYLTDWGCVTRKTYLTTRWVDEDEEEADEDDDARRTHALTILFALLQAIFAHNATDNRKMTLTRNSRTERRKHDGKSNESIIQRGNHPARQ